MLRARSPHAIVVQRRSNMKSRPIDSLAQDKDPHEWLLEFQQATTLVWGEHGIPPKGPLTLDDSFGQIVRRALNIRSYGYCSKVLLDELPHRLFNVGTKEEFPILVDPSDPLKGRQAGEWFLQVYAKDWAKHRSRRDWRTARIAYPCFDIRQRRIVVHHTPMTVED